jgi:PRC-barrel domain protein
MNDVTTPADKPDAAVPETCLVPLRRLPNYRVAAGDPDVRGWEVLGSDSRKIGEVNDLLVDRQLLRVRYLDVSLDPGLVEEESGSVPGVASAGPAQEPSASAVETPDLSPPLTGPGDLGGLGAAVRETLVRATLSDEENRLTQEHHQGFHTRHVLVPIGRARLDPEHDRILIEGMRSLDAAILPDYAGQGFDRDYEASLRRQFDEAYAPSPEQDFYAHHLYDEDRFYGPRRGPLREDTEAPQEKAVLVGRGRT